MGRRYGEWAGDPQGRPEDETRCIEEVWPREIGWIAYQCTRKRGYGPGGLYCKQHAKMIEDREARNAAIEERLEYERAIGVKPR